MIIRRKALIYLACGCGIVRTSRGFAFPGQSPSRTDPGAATAAGCGAAQLARRSRPRRAVVSSGSPEIDRFIPEEIKELTSQFHVYPSFEFIDDEGAGEALTLRNSGGTQGSLVQLGTSLISQIRLTDVSAWRIAVLGIVAHEWAHAFQYASSFRERTYLWETHADYMAGWYLGKRIDSRGNRPDPAPFAEFLYRKGNLTGFFDKDHYGSPSQRKDAMLGGFHWSLNNVNKNVWDAANEGYAYIINSVLTT